MKRLFLILISWFLNICIFANNSFDPSINYQHNNATAYIGEYLYLIPISGTVYENTATFGKMQWYPYFLNYDFDENDYYSSIYSGIMTHYKWDAFDWRDSKCYTHKRHIEGHRFYVNDVKPVHNIVYKDANGKGVIDENEKVYIWMFYLTDLDTGDKLKFIYHGSAQIYMFAFTEFPFLTRKHIEYMEYLIGTDLVFATNKTSISIPGVYYDYNPDFIDIKTGEKVQFSKPYAKWKIINIAFDKTDMYLSFIVSNGKNTLKIPYNIQYSLITKQEESPVSKYAAGVRVFPEYQWKELVKQYGEKHMALIMDTKVSDDMSIEEKYLAGGRTLANDNTIQITTDDLKNTAKSMVKYINKAKDLANSLYLKLQ